MVSVLMDPQPSRCKNYLQKQMTSKGGRVDFIFYYLHWNRTKSGIPTLPVMAIEENWIDDTIAGHARSRRTTDPLSMTIAHPETPYQIKFILSHFQASEILKLSQKNADSASSIDCNEAVTFQCTVKSLQVLHEKFPFLSVRGVLWGDPIWRKISKKNLKPPPTSETSGEA